MASFSSDAILTTYIAITKNNDNDIALPSEEKTLENTSETEKNARLNNSPIIATKKNPSISNPIPYRLPKSMEKPTEDKTIKVIIIIPDMHLERNTFDLEIGSDNKTSIVPFSISPEKADPANEIINARISIGHMILKYSSARNDSKSEKRDVPSTPKAFKKSSG